MKLDCLLDTCPQSGMPVSMLDCCGRHRTNPPCQHYGAKPWSEFAEVACLHPKAKRACPSERVENRSIFDSMIGVAHLTHIQRH